MTTHTFSSLAKDLHRMNALRDVEGYVNNTSELYLNSGYEIEYAYRHIKQGISGFKTAVWLKLLLLHRQHHLEPRLNLSSLGFDLMHHLKNNNMLIIVHGDKNLGLYILVRHFYIFKGFLEHLGNTRNDKDLSKHRPSSTKEACTINLETWYLPTSQRKNPQTVSALVRLDLLLVLHSQTLQWQASQSASFTRLHGRCAQSFAVPVPSWTTGANV